MILEIVIGLIVLIALAVLLFLLWKFTGKPISFSKEVEEGTTKIVITANRNLDKLAIVRIEKNKRKTEFARNNVKRGEKIEFHFDMIGAKERIIIRYNGEKQEYEVD